MIVGGAMIVTAYFFEKNGSISITELIKNLGFGIFCSSCVTIGITYPEYYVTKKKSLENYLTESNKLLLSFFRIEYFQYDNIEKLLLDYFHYKEMNQTIPIYNKKITEIRNEINDCYKHRNINVEPYFEIISDTEYKSLIKELDKVISQYISFSEEVSICELDSCYSDLSFFTGRGCQKYKEWIYNNLYSTSHNLFTSINNTSKKLKNLSNDTPSDYYLSAASIISESQKEFYEIDQENKSDIIAPRGYYISEVIWDTYKNRLEKNNEILRSKIHNCNVRDVQLRYYVVTNLIIK